MDTTLLRMSLTDGFNDLPAGAVEDLRLAAISLLNGGNGHTLENGFLLDYRTVEIACKRFGSPRLSARAKWSIVRRNRDNYLY